VNQSFKILHNFSIFGDISRPFGVTGVTVTVAITPKLIAPVTVTVAITPKLIARFFSAHMINLTHIIE
jgi:hypothetical protein